MQNKRDGVDVSECVSTLSCNGASNESNSHSSQHHDGPIVSETSDDSTRGDAACSTCLKRVVPLTLDVVACTGNGKAVAVTTRTSAVAVADVHTSAFAAVAAATHDDDDDNNNSHTNDDDGSDSDDSELTARSSSSSSSSLANIAHIDGGGSSNNGGGGGTSSGCVVVIASHSPTAEVLLCDTARVQTNGRTHGKDETTTAHVVTATTRGVAAHKPLMDATTAGVAMTWPAEAAVYAHRSGDSSDSSSSSGSSGSERSNSASSTGSSDGGAVSAAGGGAGGGGSSSVGSAIDNSRYTSASRSNSSSTSSSSTSSDGGGSSSRSSSGGSVVRPLNAAFVLRPRTSCEADETATSSAAAPVIVLVTDKLDVTCSLHKTTSSSSSSSNSNASSSRSSNNSNSNKDDDVARRLARRQRRHTDAAPLSYTCNLANRDERREFVTERAVALARRMTHTRILEQLLPALHLALACDDHAAPFADCAVCMSRVLPDVLAAYLRDVQHASHTRHAKRQQRQQQQQQQREQYGVASFLPLLTQLCCDSGAGLLESATTCMQRVVHLVNAHALVTLVLPLLLEMWSSAWSTPRAVAVGALGNVAMVAAAATPPTTTMTTTRAPSACEGVTARELFQCLVLSSRDACAVVRMAVVRALPTWLRVAQLHGLPYDEVPLSLLGALASDDLCDAVRYEVVQQLPCLAALTSTTTTTAAVATTTAAVVDGAVACGDGGAAGATRRWLLPCYLAACGDRSWRVRYMAARHLAAFAAYVVASDDDEAVDALMAVMASLAGDEEHEVRACVARQLAVLVTHVSLQAAEAHCVPVALRLASDTESVVRCAVVGSYAALLQCCGGGSASSPTVTLLVCSKLRCLIEDSVLAVQVAALQALEHVAAALDTSSRTSRNKSNDDDDDNNNVNSNGNGAVCCPALSCAVAASDDVGGSRRGSNDGDGATRHQQQQQQQQEEYPLRHAHSHHHTHKGKDNEQRKSSCSAMRPRSDEDNGYGDDAAPHDERVRVVRLSLFRALQRQAVCESWRVRQAVVHALRHMSRMATLDVFAPLLAAVRAALCDAVYAVRATALDTLACVARRYGAHMAAQTLTELLLSPGGELSATRRHGSFVWRILAVRCMAALLPVCDALDANDAMRRQLLDATAQLLRQWAADRVPNVRLAVAAAMPLWRAWFARGTVGCAAYNTALQQLRTGGDVDVAAAAARVTPLATAPSSPSSLSSLS